MVGIQLDGVIDNGVVIQEAVKRLFEQSRDGVAWVSFSSGPFSKRFESKLLPLGRAATLVRYGNKSVAVWTTQDDGSLVPKAIYNGLRANFQPGSSTELYSVLAEHKLGKDPLFGNFIKFPHVVIGFDPADAPDPSDVDQNKLASLAGSNDPNKMLSWFEKSKRYAGDCVFLRYDLFPEGFEIGADQPVYEDFTHLVDGDGLPKPQFVFVDTLARHGLAYQTVKAALVDPTRKRQ